MQSLLDAPRYQTLAPADRIAIQQAEDAAHECVLALLDEMKKSLSPELRRYAPNATIVGVFTGLSKLIAETQEPQLGMMLAQGLSKIVKLEVAHWQEGAYADVHR